MIVFLCSSILINEWEDLNDDNMMEMIQGAKNLKLEKEKTDLYIKDALKLCKEFIADAQNTEEFNHILLPEYEKILIFPALNTWSNSSQLTSIGDP